MPCFHPLEGWRGAPLAGQPTGIVFNRRASTGIKMRVPCGQCIGCRLERSRQWAVRAMHEAKMHDHSCFVTLTYDPENIPLGGTLDRKAFPSFVKRLRKKVADRNLKEGKAVDYLRYFHAGEYGKDTRRPHYHALIFGYDFPDKTKWSERSGNAVFRSVELEETWGLGFCEIGSLTFQSAQYVAKYIVDKKNGTWAEEYYQGREPEFATMSRRPGIGRTWYDKWKDDVYPSDQVVIDGRVSKPPAYYDRLLEAEDPQMFEAVRAARAEKRHREDETDDRLEVREVCTYARLNVRPKGG